MLPNSRSASAGTHIPNWYGRVARGARAARWRVRVGRRLCFGFRLRDLFTQMFAQTGLSAAEASRFGRQSTYKYLIYIDYLVTPGRLELPAYGLGNRRSILLSYGVTQCVQ